MLSSRTGADATVDWPRRDVYGRACEAYDEALPTPSPCSAGRCCHAWRCTPFSSYSRSPMRSPKRGSAPGGGRVRPRRPAHAERGATIARAAWHLEPDLSDPEWERVLILDE